MIELSADAINVLRQNSKQTIIVLEFDGIATIYGSVTINKRVKIGDPDLLIGGFTIGGLVPIEDQSDLLSFGAGGSGGGTTTRIRQSINPDRGTSQTTSTLTVRFVDINEEATRLITPDTTQSPAFDLLARKCKVWFGFAETAFKDDFMIIHSGIVDSINAGAGFVDLTISAPDAKVNSEAYLPAQTELSSAIDDAVTTIPVDSTTDFQVKITGPNGLIDSDLKTYIQIDDEVMEYQTTDATNFLTVTRGALGTTAASHAIDAEVISGIGITGNGVDAALKFLMSGQGGAYVSRLAKNFNVINGSLNVPNSILFPEVNSLEREFGVSIGDFVTTTGATNGANNVTNAEITAIIEAPNGGGEYITVSGVSFVDEAGTGASVAFRSKYDVWPDGLAMDADQVDIPEFEKAKLQFLPSYDVDFFETEALNGKDFIEGEMFKPAGAYGVPRKARYSMGVHFPPIPGTTLVTIDTTNVMNPDQIVLSRSIVKNFQNTISTAFDKLRLDDVFLSQTSNVSATSLQRIDVGIKALNVVARGLRSTAAAAATIATASARRLRKYQFGAESFRCRLNMESGLQLEVGDIVIVDMADLQISDIQTGTRAGEQRLMQIDNKDFDMATGRSDFTITDTSFNKDARFGLISPVSRVRTGVSASQIIVESGEFSSPFGTQEARKYENIIGARLVVRTDDFVTSSIGVISAVSGSSITFESPLSFTPSSGMLVELAGYTSQPEDVTIRYGFMVDDPPGFADGSDQYLMV